MKQSNIFRLLTKPFMSGVLFYLPLLVTIYLGYWIFTSLERIVRVPVLWIIPHEYYMPGVGIILSVLIVFVTGLLMQNWFFQTVASWFEKAILTIPLVKKIYKTLKDFVDFFAPKDKVQYEKVVKVCVPNNEGFLVGLQTRDHNELPEVLKSNEDDYTLVYFPMSYNVGGYSVFLPKSWITPLDWSVKDATSYMLSAGISKMG